MARFLSVESGGAVFAAALCDGDSSRVRLESAAPHSRRALPAIVSLMRESGLAFSDLDFFAFAAGPGRFGGLRLACGIAQGLAYTAQKPVVAAPSLTALARPFFGGESRRIVAALPAHREHVYFAAFARDDGGEWATVCAPRTVAVAAPPRVFGADDGAPPPLAVGAGFARYADSKLADMADWAGAADAADKAGVERFASQPDIAAVAGLSLDLFARGESAAAIDAAPFYARDKVALRISERRAAA